MTDHNRAAIQTWYNGCYFRSRLEARWAVLFDRLSIRWEYEPQGYHLRATPIEEREQLQAEACRRDPWCQKEGHSVSYCEPIPGEHDDDLGQYLPDFWLPDAKMWWEVKGNPHLGPADQKKPLRLATVTGFPCVRAVGDIPWYTEHRFDGLVSRSFYSFHSIFYPWWGRDFVAPYHCESCDHVQLDLQTVRQCPTCGSPRYSHGTPMLMKAYKAARSARFEHGESGAS